MQFTSTLLQKISIQNVLLVMLSLTSRSYISSGTNATNPCFELIDSRIEAYFCAEHFASDKT